ncbi:MAG: hypothetical protein J7518_10955 [Nocardioidaceae bacterium]|nr:hypothetical protein [Nocardioidaceae bacterium]
MRALAASTLVLLAGCGSVHSDGPPASGSADYATYGSVEDLAREADFVGVVRIGEVSTRELDDGGSGDPADGVPMAFWNAEVTETWRGEPLADQKIVVAWPDLEKEQVDGRSDLAAGQVVVLFARRLTPAEAPGIKTQEVFYAPVGGDNGVLDVKDEVAAPRSADLERLRADDAESGDFAPALEVLKGLVSKTPG